MTLGSKGQLVHAYVLIQFGSKYRAYSSLLCDIQSSWKYFPYTSTLNT